jgi:hypothetical protein
VLVVRPVARAISDNVSSVGCSAKQRRIEAARSMDWTPLDRAVRESLGVIGTP